MALCLCCYSFAQSTGWVEQNAFVVSGDIMDPSSGSTSTIGQIFVKAPQTSAMMLNEGVHNATLVLDTVADEICEGYPYSGYGFTRAAELNHVSVPEVDEEFDTSRYSLAGIDLGFDSIIRLELTIHATQFTDDTTVLLVDDARLAEDPATHIAVVTHSTSDYGCDSVVSMFVYRVTPNDTLKQPGKIGHPCDPLDNPLADPAISPVPAASDLAETHTPLESYCFPTGDTTLVTWTVTVADSTVTFTQPVIILWPECPAMSGPDGDGNDYVAVRVAYDCWTQTNLRPTSYKTGGDIDPDGIKTYPEVPNETTYGKLYTYAAAMGTSAPDADGNYQGICPDGWHIPDEAKLTELYTTNETADLQATYDWLPVPGTNATQFTLLPGGFYNAENGFFENLYVKAYLWSTTPGATVTSVGAEFGAGCTVDGIYEYNRNNALSVRCLMNAE